MSSFIVSVKLVSLIIYGIISYSHANSILIVLPKFRLHHIQSVFNNWIIALCESQPVSQNICMQRTKIHCPIRNIALASCHCIQDHHDEMCVRRRHSLGILPGTQCSSLRSTTVAAIVAFSGPWRYVGATRAAYKTEPIVSSMFWTIVCTFSYALLPLTFAA